MTYDTIRDCRVRIIKAQLCVRYVKLSYEKYRNIQQSLPVTPACYRIKCVVMKTHSVVQRISSLNWENAHVGHLPNRVFMALVNNGAYAESIAKNSSNFKYFNTAQVGIYVNAEMPGPSLKLIFTDNQ